MAKSAEIRHEVRQLNERTSSKAASNKRVSVIRGDSTSGFGVLTNALLFGQDPEGGNPRDGQPS